MNENPFPQEKILAYSLLTDGFIKHCKERGIEIDSALLALYADEELVLPVATDEYGKYYDPLQIYHISQLKCLGKNKDYIKQKFNKFSPIFSILQVARYYYSPQTLGVLIIPNNLTTYEEWQKERASFNPEPFVKEIGIPYEEIERWRIDLVADAAAFDPFKNPEWYNLIKNIRRKHHQKYRGVGGSVLLAHDYYIMAEMLTVLLEELTGEKVLPIDAIFDMTGGKWRETNCEKCGTSFQRRAISERYCGVCKKEVSKELGGAWRCENKKCNSVLYKFVDNNELLNNIFLGHKGETKTETYARLDYGLLTLVATCGKCGRKNYKQIQQGWWQ